VKKRTLALAAVVAGLVGGCFEHPGLQKITPTTTPGGCSGTSANGLFAGGAGSQSDPFQICTPAQFLNMGNLTNDGLYFRLDWI
jgi:hypothetical protein